MDIIERFVRRHARRTTRNGKVVIITNGDPTLVDAFAHLGWEDPHEDADPPRAREETATVRDVERAVLPRPTGRTVPPVKKVRRLPPKAKPR